jgi:6-phosphogluconolactonase (cycloisomerase 2 family)
MHFDANAGALVQRAGVVLPENVQYARAHPSGRMLYVAWSNGVDNDRHGVTAFRIDPATGALAQAGDPVALPHRTIHATVDNDGAFLLLAFNKPRTVMVFRIAADGAIGPLVAQPRPIDGGPFVHQVRVARGNSTVLTCAMGGTPGSTAPDQLGRITNFAFVDGVLTPRQTVVPGPGLGPRHLDLHPTLPLVYVAFERGNKLSAYRLDGDALGATPAFTTDIPPNLPGQHPGAIHVHPQGGFVYVTNRKSAVQEQDGKPVFAGGENTIAAFAINPRSGEPTLIQHEDTRGFEPRTFAINPGGRFLVVANQKTITARADEAPTPPNLALFRLAADGKLAFVSTTPMTQGGDAFWAGMVGLPA